MMVLLTRGTWHESAFEAGGWGLGAAFREQELQAEPTFSWASIHPIKTYRGELQGSGEVLCTELCLPKMHMCKS